MSAMLLAAVVAPSSLVFVQPSVARAASTEVLILDSTVTGGASSIEAQAVLDMGLTPVLASPAVWASKTAADFAAYRGIILGDDTCGGSAAAAIANTMTWGPVVDGNVILVGTDPVFHFDQGGTTLTRQGIQFALANANATGLYATLSCYLEGSAPNTPVPLFDGLAPQGFTVTDAGCFNNVHIVASHPALTGLTDAALSNWSCSVHEAFDRWPASFQVLAIARNLGSSFTASDGSVGTPYILARGSGLKTFPLSVSPTSASPIIGSTHTVVAELLDGVTSQPVVGALIRATASRATGVSTPQPLSCGGAGTCTTGVNGTVSFSYSSTEARDDVIDVWFDQNNDGVRNLTEPQVRASASWQGNRFVQRTDEEQAGTPPGSTHVGDPVNTANGNLTDQFTDIDLGLTGMAVLRSYNGLGVPSSDMGARWRVGVGSSLESGPAGAVFLRESDGTRFTFPPNGSGGFVSPVGADASLVADPAAPVGGGTLPMLRLEHRDGRVERFDTAGRLIQVLGWDGTSASVTYNGGAIASVTSSSGPTLTFTRGSNGLISGVTSSTGPSVSYVYSADLLTQVIDQNGSTTTMTYTPEGWLEQVTDAAGVVTMLNTYDAGGRVLTQTSASGGVTTFTYNLADGSTLVHDSVTNTSVRYQHDQDGRVVGISDPFGLGVIRAYDADSNQTGGVDRNGLAASATYDSLGNMLTVTEPGVGTTTYGYDALSRVTSVAAPGQGTTTYTYEGVERIPSTVTNALNQTTTYDVVNGLVMSVTDADGVTVAYGYDAQRRLTSVANEYNQTTTYQYNARGDRTKMISPSGRTTTWAYDPVTFRLSSVTAPDGGATSYTYDTAGRVATVTDPTGAVTTNAYDAAGRLATVTEPGGAVTTYVYDGNDQLLRMIEPGGADTETVYGPLGRVTATKDQLDRTTSYEYDPEGRQKKLTDAGGGVRQTVFDAQGRPFKTIDPANRETVTAYDAFGRVQTVTAPGNLVTTYAYDALGRVRTVTDPRGGVTTTAFTPGGRTNSVTDPVGLVTSYGYDLAGRQVSITAPGNLTTTYTYNADSEVATVTSPGGLVTTTTYDLAGRVKTVTDPAGVVTTNSWSLRGELLTSKVGAEGTVAYTYNPNGTMATATDALGRVTTFGYDARKNLTSRTAPNGAVFSWTYNAANQVLTAVDPSNRTTTYTYDAAGRLATVTDPSGRVQTSTYNLDGTPNTIGFTGGTTTTYGYDPAGRVATLSDATGVMTLGYEPGGQLASTLTATGRRTTWAYDAAGRRTAMTVPDGLSYAYSYDTAGRPLRITPGEVMADTFTGANGSAPETNRWFPATASGATASIQANAFRMAWANTAGSTASLSSKAAVAQNSTQLVKFQFADTSGTNVGKFVVKARNSSAGHVRVEFVSNSATANVFLQVGQVITLLGTVPTVVSTGARWARLEVSGTTVRVSTWADGTPQPTGGSTFTNVTGLTTAGAPRLEVVRTSGANSVTIDDYRHTDAAGQSPLVTYGYNADSQVTSETLVGGSRARTYTLGRLTNFTETLPGLSLTTGRTYDTTGRIATETTGGVTTTYGYDAASQLTSATPTTGSARVWTYDQNGYRTSERIGTITTRYQRDIAGQLCWTTTGTMPATPTCAAPPSGATTYTHDAAGRMLTETVTATNKVTYTYDANGRLATSQRVNGTTTTTQTRTYDQLNQLIATANTGGTTTTTSRYDWDPTNPATQLTAITTGNATSTLAAGPTGWTTRREGPLTTSIALDIYGSAVNATGTTSLTRAAGYAPFGTPTGTNTFEPRLGYRGELVLDTLLYLRNREHQGTLGQFSSVDPLSGVPGTTTLNNSYTYTNNKPLKLIDPLGLYGSKPVTDNVINGGDLTPSWAFGVAPLFAPALAPAAPAAGAAVANPVTLTVVGVVVVFVGLSWLIDLDSTPVPPVNGTTTTTTTTTIPPPAEQPSAPSVPATQSNGPPTGTTTTIPTASCSDDPADPDKDITQEPTNRHHSFPKYMGGDENQPLTSLPRSVHVQLHRDMNTFLQGKVRNGVSMRPSCVNPGSKIRDEFTLQERIDALKDFYNGPGNVYTQARLDFLAQVR